MLLRLPARATSVTPLKVINRVTQNSNYPAQVRPSLSRGNKHNSNPILQWQQDRNGIMRKSPPENSHIAAYHARVLINRTTCQ
jgi:hypothetical protein